MAIWVLIDTGCDAPRNGEARLILTCSAVIGFTIAPGSTACAAPVRNVTDSPPKNAFGPP